MKKVLFVILSLYNGGAEKSLVNMLNELPQDKYEVDLLLFRREGMFLKQVPKWVNVLDTPDTLRKLYGPVSKSGNMFFTKVFGTCISRARENTSYTRLGYRWIHYYSRKIEKLPKKYDVAVAYTSNEIMHFVSEKVDADKKIVWIHNDFKSAGHSLKYDHDCFKNMELVTISDECARIVEDQLSDLDKEIHCIANITSSNATRRRADEFFPEEFDRDCFKILSIGRLNNQKGFDLAVEAASLLRDKGLVFKWFFIGDGELYESLSKMITEKNLEDTCILLGTRENPYPYIKNCDLFAQTSRYEGKSVVLDEAKILAAPILVTNYPTVHDQIVDGKEGYIVELSPQAIADGIEKMIKDKDLRDSFSDYLGANEYGNQDEIGKYIALIGE